VPGVGHIPIKLGFAAHLHLHRTYAAYLRQIVGCWFRLALAGAKLWAYYRIEARTGGNPREPLTDIAGERNAGFHYSDIPRPKILP